MILITGGTGHVAAYVTQRLLAMGEKVTLLDVRSDYDILELVCGSVARRSVETVVGDITTPSELIAAVMAAKPSAMIHLASLLPPTSERDAYFALQQITGGMAQALEAARLCRLDKLVWASATSVFGPPERHGGPDTAVSDEAPHYPRTLYGITKSANERLATLYRSRYGVDSIGFRFCQGYGPGKKRGRPFGYQMFEKALAGEPCAVPYGDDIMNWQFVEDIAEIIVRALSAPHRGLDVYNTTGEVLTMAETVETIVRLVPQARLTREPGTAELVWRYDASRLAGDLGFDRPTPVADGFAATFDRMRAWQRRGAW